MKRTSVLFLLLGLVMMLPVTGHAQQFSLPTGYWSINGNGYQGVLYISSIDSSGAVSASMWGYPLVPYGASNIVRGYWDERSHRLTLMRVISSDPTTPVVQVYTGYLYAQNILNPSGPKRLAGVFEGPVAGAGGSADHTVWGWSADPQNNAVP